MKLPPLEKAAARLDALTRRDRMVLLGGLLAGLVAIDVQFVLAMRERRVAAVQAAAQQPTTNQAEIDAAAHAQRQARLKEIQQKLEQRHKELSAQGLASPPQAIFDELRKTLAIPGVQVLSLKALPDSTEAQAPAASAAAAEPAEPASDAEGAQPAAPAPPAAIYRHRTEVRIAGTLEAVSRVVQGFEQPTLPLRLERVRFSAASDPSRVEAYFVLLTIGQDHTWLAL